MSLLLGNPSTARKLELVDASAKRGKEFLNYCLCLSTSNCISDPVSGELRTAALVIPFVKGLKERRECVGIDLIVFSVLCCWNKEGPAK